MAIELKDIRTAVRVYLNTKVAVSISELTPDVPGVISPNEGFTFSVTARNAALTEGGIGLINVRYHLKVANSAVAKLIAPPSTTATSRSAAGAILSPGSLVTEMFLSPPSVTTNNALSAGDIDTITGLKGKAGNVVQNTDISLDILADPDLNFLFPRNENSVTVSRTVSVV